MKTKAKGELIGEFEHDLRQVAETIVHEISDLMHDRLNQVIEDCGEQSVFVTLEAIAQAVALAAVAHQVREAAVAGLGPDANDKITEAAKDLGQKLAGALSS